MNRCLPNLKYESAYIFLSFAVKWEWIISNNQEQLNGKVLSLAENPFH